MLTTLVFKDVLTILPFDIGDSFEVLKTSVPSLYEVFAFNDKSTSFQFSDSWLPPMIGMTKKWRSEGLSEPLA
jgi:hypothetical protein